MESVFGCSNVVPDTSSAITTNDRGDMAMKAIHGDGPWLEDDGEDLDEEVAKHHPGEQSHDEDPD